MRDVGTTVSRTCVNADAVCCRTRDDIILNNKLSLLPHMIGVAYRAGVDDWGRLRDAKFVEGDTLAAIPSQISRLEESDERWTF